jgi:hypothetical protein
VQESRVLRKLVLDQAKIGKFMPGLLDAIVANEVLTDVSMRQLATKLASTDVAQLLQRLAKRAADKRQLRTLRLGGNGLVLSPDVQQLLDKSIVTTLSV